MEKQLSFFSLTGEVIFAEDGIKELAEYNADGEKTGRTSPHRVTKITMSVTGANGDRRAVIVTARDLPETFKCPASGDKAFVTPEIKSYKLTNSGFVEVRC